MRARGVTYYVLLCSFRLEMNIYSYSKHRTYGELVKVSIPFWCTITQSIISHLNHTSVLQLFFIFRYFFMKKQTGSKEAGDNQKLIWDIFENEGSVYTMWYQVPLWQIIHRRAIDKSTFQKWADGFWQQYKAIFQS